MQHQVNIVGVLFVCLCVCSLSDQWAEVVPKVRSPFLNIFYSVVLHLLYLFIFVTCHIFWHMYAILFLNHLNCEFYTNMQKKEQKNNVFVHLIILRVY